TIRTTIYGGRPTTRIKPGRVWETHPGLEIPELTTDGDGPYHEAGEPATDRLNDATLVTLYGSDPDAERRYHPVQSIGVERRVNVSDPNPVHISTNYIGTQRLTKRLGLRSFERMTKALSKKVENLGYAVAL